MTLKGAAPDHEGEARPDRWALTPELAEVAARWGIEPARDLAARLMDSLRGKLLIAGRRCWTRTSAARSCSSRSTTEDGAMGLVLNRPSTTTVSEAVPDLDWLAEPDADAHRVGGPVAPDGRDRARRVERPRAGGRAGRAGPRLRPGRPRRHGGRGDRRPPRAGVTPATPAGAPISSRPSSRRRRGSSSRRAARRSSRRTRTTCGRPCCKRKGRRFALLSTMPLDPSLN